MRVMGKGIAIGILATLAIAVTAWLAVVYTGAYNVAATDPHTDVVRWTFETAMERSIASRARDITLPGRFSDDAVAEGARHYADTCVHCHGAPGREPAEWSGGMRPEPPHLVDAAGERTPQEIYWIVEHGIRMTGMPAFGPHHDAAEIEAITAFVTRLPGLSEEDYRRLTGAEAAAPAHVHRHEHGG